MGWMLLFHHQGMGEPPAAFAGPYCMERAYTYQPGSEAEHTHQPGAERFHTYKPNAEATTVVCD